MIERMVLFGACGDLTSRLLLPAVAQLAEDELLPDELALVGSDITDWSTDDFREHIAGKLLEHADVTPSTRDRVVSMLSFQPADVTRSEDVSRVTGDHHPDTLVYLAPTTTTAIIVPTRKSEIKTVTFSSATPGSSAHARLSIAQTM